MSESSIPVRVRRSSLGVCDAGLIVRWASKPLKAAFVFVIATGLISTAVASPYGHPAPPAPPPQPPAYRPPPVQPPVRPPSQVQERIIQQRARQGALQAAQRDGAMQLKTNSQRVAKKVNSWEDIGKLSAAELAALFQEWGLLPADAGKMTGAQLKALWLGQARAQGVPKAQIDKMLSQGGGAWSQMASQINAVVAATGDPNVAMGALFKAEYAKTCMCSPKAFADALGRAETRLGGQMQGAMANALGGQGVPVSALPSPPVVTYATGDQPVLVAQAIINQGQTQVATVTPAPVAPPPTPAPVAPPPTPAPIAPPPAPAPVAPPPAPAPVAPPPAPAPVAPPPAPAPVAPPPAPAPIAPPPAPAPIAPPPAPVTPLLELTLPPMPDPGLLIADPAGPDMTPAEKSGAGDRMPDVKVPAVPAVPGPPACKTTACFQKQLDLLAIERKVIQQNQRVQPMIQILDTLGSMAGSVAIFTGPAAPAVAIVGGTLKLLKVLITAANEAKVTRIQGGDQFAGLNTFIVTTGVEGSTEVIKDVVGGGLGKFIPEGSSKVVKGSGEFLISLGVDNAATIGEGAVDVVFSDGKKVTADTKAFVGDVARAVGGTGF